jgi:hypothetical protein
MKARDAIAVAALRSALAAIDNAEAVGPSSLAPTSSSSVAGATLGVGSAEVERAALSYDDMRRLVELERDERLSSALELDHHGATQAAERRRDEAAVLERYLG